MSALYVIDVLSFDDQGWEALYEHLERTQNWRWVKSDDQIRDRIVFVSAFTARRAVGHISLLIQPLTVPGNPPSPLTDQGGQILRETFVQTFFVEEEHRRQGLGRRLQEKALEVSASMGCWQMRSWSTPDKTANYRLKLALGFCFCPAVQELPSGQGSVAGGYFIKNLSGL